MNILIIFTAILTTSHATFYSTNIIQRWINYKLNYKKQYATEVEEVHRMKIFVGNHRFIEEHNTRFAQGLETYTLEENQFADWTLEEFTNTMLNFNKSLIIEDTRIPDDTELYVAEDISAANEKDWRKNGAVTGVKNQLQCGSCWAFSAIASFESAYYIKHKKLISFSEQQLVDCSKKEGNNGCQGGLMTNAFNYIQHFGGIEKESDYKYTAKAGKCNAKTGKIVAKISSFKNLQRGNENQLLTVTDKEGPVSVAIDAGHKSFQFYKKGIYNEKACKTNQLNHGVTVAGYGNGYWLVKNSWGTTWGEKGYIRMSRNKKNQCGIATMATIPKVA